MDAKLIHIHVRWLNGDGGRWTGIRSPPPIPPQLSAFKPTHTETETQPPFPKSAECLEVVLLIYAPPPRSIAPAFQPPLKSDKRSECWMVIFYWQEVGSARRGHGGWGTLEIREGTQFLVRTKGDKMVLSAELQPNLTRGKAFWCVLDCVQVFLRSCLPFINSPPTHG